MQQQSDNLSFNFKELPLEVQPFIFKEITLNTKRNIFATNKAHHAFWSKYYVDDTIRNIAHNKLTYRDDQRKEVESAQTFYENHTITGFFNVCKTMTKQITETQQSAFVSRCKSEINGYLNRDLRTIEAEGLLEKLLISMVTSNHVRNYTGVINQLVPVFFQSKPTTYTKDSVFSFGELDTIIRSIAEESLKALEGKTCENKDYLIEICKRILKVPEKTKADADKFLQFNWSEKSSKTLEYTLFKRFSAHWEFNKFCVPNPSKEPETSVLAEASNWEFNLK